MIINRASQATQRQIRTISTSRVCRGSDSHSHGYDDGSNEVYAPANLLSAGWLKLFGFAGLSAVALSAYSSTQDGKEPFLTRYLSYNKSSTEESKTNTDKLLALKKELADETLLMSDAHRPTLIRLSNPGTFEQASPHKIAVGSQSDLSDLKVKTNKE
ncbi:hypothetical protein E3Q17_00805 [Wallemia mellicola]|uniref:Uncharacterized protein n=1 Tax=Wallemia mellicola TaxID=1708541 RepID=A0A4T0Q8G6_9BASI|nr:hypothetical protein E3Q17_00805 [Wallemia mellicola]TIC07825.1 hypothetical protein E3Q16_00283 [Wallemia mellicola]TIC20060.1 hypothetical protein E3Q13_00789 [Wallemia mellicola]